MAEKLATSSAPCVLVQWKDLLPGAKYSRVHLDRLIEHDGFLTRLSANRFGGGEMKLKRGPNPDPETSTGDLASNGR
jgi:hypothetical protein